MEEIIEVMIPGIEEKDYCRVMKIRAKQEALVKGKKYKCIMAELILEMIEKHDFDDKIVMKGKSRLCKTGPLETHDGCIIP